MTFYQGLLDDALIARDIDATIAENNGYAITSLVEAIDGANDMIAGAVSDCKVEHYGIAQ